MAGRAQAFSDPTVVALLRDRFVPVAEDSTALERQPDAKGAFFRQIAEQGHYGGRTFPTATRQGSYAFTAAGRFLGSVNTRDPRGMAAMMEEALARWDAGDGVSPPHDLDPETDPETDDGYPARGLALRLAARDLPRPVDTRPDDWRKIAWNLDYAWFTEDEARAIVPTPRLVGQRRAAPWAVGRRLARFHLRDFVRGEPFAWPEAAIRRLDLHATIVGSDGAEVRLAIDGAIKLEHEMQWIAPEDGREHRHPSGFDTALSGEATWDEASARFVAFDLVAVGPRWGASQYNNREDDLGPAPLGVAFELAGPTPAERTPPHCLRTFSATGPASLGSRVKVAADDYFRGAPTGSARGEETNR